MILDTKLKVKSLIREPLTTQEDRVLTHILDNGSINPLESWLSCGVYRLSAVIHQLRNNGIPIENIGTNVKNRYGEDCKVGKYVIPEEIE